MSIEDILGQRIMVLDGAMGTMIQRYTLSETDFRGERFQDHAHDVKGNNDLLSLTRPDIIGEIHRAYLEAGADLIETKTFSSNTVSMADYGKEDLYNELNEESARIDREEDAKFTRTNPKKTKFDE